MLLSLPCVLAIMRLGLIDRHRFMLVKTEALRRLSIDHGSKWMKARLSMTYK